mgnify:CR=1 FL=1
MAYKGFTVVSPKADRFIKAYTGTGGLYKGQLAVLDSGTAIQASEGVATAIVLGVSLEDYDAGEVCSLIPVQDNEFEMDVYQGGAADTFADSNIGTPFDIYVSTEDTYLDANDTAGAFLVLQSYDNTNHKATVRFLSTVNYYA